MCLGTGYMLSSYQLGNVCCCFLLFFGQKVEICLRSLGFAVPAGSNKLQTCFPGSNSTFAAPSLRHRPYHYPHKQQKCLCNLSAGRNFSSCLLSAGSIRHLCGRDLHWMHKSTKKIHTCDERAGVVLFPVRKKRGWEHVRIYWELTDTVKLVESVVRDPVVQ